MACALDLNVYFMHKVKMTRWCVNDHYCSVIMGVANFENQFATLNSAIVSLYGGNTTNIVVLDWKDLARIECLTVFLHARHTRQNVILNVTPEALKDPLVPIANTDVIVMEADVIDKTLPIVQRQEETACVTIDPHGGTRGIIVLG